MSKTLILNIPEKLKKDLQELAAEKEIPVSSLVKRALGYCLYEKRDKVFFSKK